MTQTPEKKKKTNRKKFTKIEEKKIVLDEQLCQNCFGVNMDHDSKNMAQYMNLTTNTNTDQFILCTKCFLSARDTLCTTVEFYLKNKNILNY